MRIGRAALALGAVIGLGALLRRPTLPRAVRVLRISRVVFDLDRAESFYRNALGFQTIARGEPDPAALAALGLDHVGAVEVLMRLGADDVALVRLTPRGHAYPAGSHCNDLWFQHMAIVVGDMEAAYARLVAHGGWQPISVGGPQTLPPSDGTVRAFKFRDPDGHPLELLWFPPGQGRAVWHRGAAWHRGLATSPFLGIDHSALAIEAASRSLRFYRALGFRVADRSRNAGPAQSKLDGLPGARLRVFSLRPGSPAGPGLELLAYRPPGRRAAGLRPGDIAADWTTIEVSHRAGAPLRCLRDPDGHLLLLTG